jgi:acetolactate synthase-1/2/3 large subunit
MGSTDYDMYRNNDFPPLKALIRVDICPQQLAKHPADICLQGDAKLVLESLLQRLQALSPTSPVSFNKTQNHQRAEQTRAAAFAELPENYREHIQLLNLMRDTYPNAILVGDSTQLVYAGSMYYDHDCAGGWFHAATGYGALGYGIPAAIGAALAAPERQVICITGDGGAQFSFAELMVAVQEQLPIIFIVWNNQGYLEIENAMVEVDIVAVGCDPIPPDFEYLAKACAMPYLACSAAVDSLEAALVEGKKMIEASARKQPIMIEISV